MVAVAIALTRLYALYRRQDNPGRPNLVRVVPGAAYVVREAAEHYVVKGTSGGVSDITQNSTLPFKAPVPAVARDFRLMSWTHLGMYDFNLIKFIALAAFVVGGPLVLRSTTAPVHERIALSFS